MEKATVAPLVCTLMFEISPRTRLVAKLKICLFSLCSSRLQTLTASCSRMNTEHCLQVSTWTDIPPLHPRPKKGERNYIWYLSTHSIFHWLPCLLRFFFFWDPTWPLRLTFPNRVCCKGTEGEERRLSLSSLLLSSSAVRSRGSVVVDGVRCVNGVGGVAGWGGGERAKVTGADPPSLTARTPSPRPPRLKKKKGKQCEGWAGRGFAWTRWRLIGRLKLKRGSFRREE